MTSSGVPRKHARRAVLGTLAAAAVGGPVLLRGLANAQAADVSAAAALVWSPVPSRDGLNAFEGVEDDRSGSHPGVTHIYPQGDTYRVDMHTRDRDGSDRQRNEVKGMKQNGTVLTWGNGETWRLTYDLFIPDALRGTTSFTHIFQLKRPGNGTGPLATIGLRRNGSAEYLTLRPFVSGGEIGRVPLSAAWNRWISIEMTFLIGDKGTAHFVCTEGGRTLADDSRSGIDLWLGDRIRPKWGIYRSLDDSKQLHDCYLLLRNMRGYRG
ncbi:hypothetical protein ACNTMW_16295 [Planosporangium sp. 12N6]|uniref:hypothetical protein n=1 Tax=Planosporangium spinosum TaxID=3402278 RepID=UPI003CF26BC0